MRLTRLVLGALIVVAAVWIIVAEQMASASANAFVNARLSTLRAPIAGEIEMPDRALGSAVTEGEVLVSVFDRRSDSIRLNDLEMELAFAQAQTARLETVAEETQGMIDTLSQRSDRFTERTIAELELRLAHARDRLRLLGVTPGDGTDELDEAAEESLAGAADSVTQSRAREEVDVLENALVAARSGVFVGDGYNDAPNAEQRRVELETVLDGIQADLQEARAREEAIDTRVIAEQISVNRLSSAEIRSTVDGRLREVLAADGERLQRGEPVLRLVDCGSLFVTLSVTESVYNGLQVGDPAEFLMAGREERYPGTVARLSGAGAGTIYTNLAVAPSAQHLERYDVAVEVPGLVSDPALDCPVGRTGRVFFEARPLDWVRGLF